MNRIKELRTENGLLQTDLANLLKVRQNTISNWETGRTEPDQDALLAMSQYFDVSIDYIIGNSDAKKAPSIEGAQQEIELSPLEQQLLMRYRRADPALQEAVFRVLGQDQENE